MADSAKYPNSNNANNLEERTYQFAKRVRVFCRNLKWDVVNLEDIKQIIRASGSVAANYIEANENLGEKDLKMKIRISRREAKETGLFIKLLHTGDIQHLDIERDEIFQESVELRKIFTAILKKLP